MAVTPKVLFRGAATLTTTTTLYTVPSATTTVVTNILVSNTDTTAHTFTASFDGVKWADAVLVPPNGLLAFDMKQVLVPTDTIQGGASNTAINFHISGTEIA